MTRGEGAENEAPDVHDQDGAAGQSRQRVSEQREALYSRNIHSMRDVMGCRR